MSLKNQIPGKPVIVALAILLFLMITMSTLIGCQSDQNGITTTNQQEDPQEDVSENNQTGKILLVTGEYAPYTSENLPQNGVFTEIVTAVMNETGLAYEIRFYPWARGTEMIENGEAWGTFPYGYQEKLAQNFDYSDPVIKGHHHFYYLTQNRQLAEAAQNFTTISDFKNYTFGGTNGYWYGDKSTIESQGVKTEWASDTDALIKMLYAGRIDFFIEDEQVADAAIARLFPNDSGAFAKLPAVASYRDYYLVISRSYPHAAEIKNKFNVALKKLTDNGTINRILTENGISGN